LIISLILEKNVKVNLIRYPSAQKHHNWSMYNVLFKIFVVVWFDYHVLYMYCCWRSSYQEGMVWTTVTGLTPSYLCVPLQDRNWISNVICRRLFVQTIPSW
jgi:hypothetical protein